MHPAPGWHHRDQRSFLTLSAFLHSVSQHLLVIGELVHPVLSPGVNAGRRTARIAPEVSANHEEAGWPTHRHPVLLASEAAVARLVDELYQRHAHSLDVEAALLVLAAVLVLLQAEIGTEIKRADPSVDVGGPVYLLAR